MTRNAFKGEVPEEEPSFKQLIAQADGNNPVSVNDPIPTAEEIIQTRRERELTKLKLLAEKGSTTAQHQLDLLMRDQEG